LAGGLHTSLAAKSAAEDQNQGRSNISLKSCNSRISRQCRKRGSCIACGAPPLHAEIQTRHPIGARQAVAGASPPARAPALRRRGFIQLPHDRSRFHSIGIRFDVAARKEIDVAAEKAAKARWRGPWRTQNPLPGIQREVGRVSHYSDLSERNSAPHRPIRASAGI
jgi:hypothetical protein